MAEMKSQENFQKKNFMMLEFVLCLTGFLCLAAVLFGVREFRKGMVQQLQSRGHGNGSVQAVEFGRSSRKLRNPERGFYHMHGFLIEDTDMDFAYETGWRYCHDQDTALTLIQINLLSYREGPISEKGLENIDAMFAALRATDKKLIVRFLYDWDGKGLESEPAELSVILNHMEQLGPILQKYADEIFVVQGLFIGNWGEMNGSNYHTPENLQLLAGKLAQVTSPNTYLSVRMPMQWRMITGTAEAEQVQAFDGSLPARLGLFNDGMLGSFSDYGTYGDQTREENGDFTYWNREEELAFQDILCGKVPQGGEVIVDNPYNDLDNAIKDFQRMHITYLNSEFDEKVLEKWENTSYQGDPVYDGMDGKSYIERHLGYRLLIAENELSYQPKEDLLKVRLVLKNEGFAPPYFQKTLGLWICREDGTRTFYPVDGDIREIGSAGKGELALEKELSLQGEPEGSFTVYFQIMDPDTGKQLVLANREDAAGQGYCLGLVTLDSVESYRELFQAEYQEEWKLWKK